ncbi:MAG: hypothetical protein MUC50_14160 [Myxococcota bacterium]|nr:hypothetical protein [Myxococcota bacterium]
MKSRVSLLVLSSLIGLGCGAALPRDPSKGALTPSFGVAAYVSTAPPRLTPSSPEAAAANKPRGDAALRKGELVLRGSTAGLVVVELEGTEALERSSVDLPGATSDLALVGGLVYAAQGPAGLAVIDLADPTSPVTVSFLDTPGGCVRLWASGHDVVVAEGSLGLALLDASDARAPRATATWRGRDYVRHAVAYGQFIYAADGRAGIAILERRGERLQEIGRLEPGGDARALFVQDERLLAALGGAGLAVFDVQAPAHPALLSLQKLKDAARDVEADERNVFVAGGDAGLLILELAAEKRPAIVGTLPTPTPVNRVRLDGHRVLVGADSTGLLVVDVSDRAHPRQIYPGPDPE